VWVHPAEVGPCSDPSLSISFLSAGHSWCAVAAATERKRRRGRRGDIHTERERADLMGVAEEFLSFVTRDLLLARRV